MTDTSADAVEHECRNIHDCTILLMIPAMYGQLWQDMLRALSDERDELQAQVEKADRLLRAVDRAKLDQFPTVVTKADAYRKARGEG